MDRLSPQDASFLHAEDENTHMHVATACLFEGPPPAQDQVLELVRAKLPRVPRYRQKVRFVPLDAGRPVWVDDPHFKLDYHVRRTALPRPGGDQELENLMGRLTSQPLDRARPLWEMWVVEGLGGDRWLLFQKIHHAMVDGISTVDIMTLLFDREPTAPVPVPDDWRPEPEPSDARLLADALAERATSPYEQFRALRAALRAPQEGRQRYADVVRGLSALQRVAQPAPAWSINGPIGPHRRWLWARTALSDVKAVRARHGGTVNDVVLAAITRGFRDLFASRGEPVEGRTLRSLVPVSVRAPEERGVHNNRVSAMFAELPVGIADPVERLRSITDQMRGLKNSKQALAGDALTRLQVFAPPELLALGARLAARQPQRGINTVTTNVPGPQDLLYAVGRRMLEAFVFVPLGTDIRAAVAILSYAGWLGFGVTADYDTVPDADVLRRGIEEGLAELKP